MLRILRLLLRSSLGVTFRGRVLENKGVHAVLRIIKDEWSTDAQKYLRYWGICTLVELLPPHHGEVLDGRVNEIMEYKKLYINVISVS